MAKKTSLNKGLEALLGDVAESKNSEKPQKNVKKETKEKSSEILLSQIRANQYQPRTSFDQKKLEELAESIKKHGVIQPVLVRKDGKGFELVAGERRFRAAKLAKLKKIPVVVSNISDVQSLEIAILENIQREDLNPLEVAKGYQRLKDEFGYTQEAVAKSVGKPRSSVANSLRLLTLSPKIQDEIDKGAISEGHAKVLLSVDGIKAEQLLMRIISENLSVRDLEKQITESSPQTSKKEKKSRDELNLESALSSRIGSKVTIEDKDGKGKMVIKYYSYEELDGIIEKISH
ncbi:ParB/RepB/Spo0J family partition protein [SAR86 cluster bacterium]|jgi:ParB family chromosome partitioning protein|uniref:Probable chromosome-partitioning protein ParB n=1 Tax=SAR86 cluster bacterium TaxID=2030880 RepID=A0A9Q8TZK9_9GAMM|nr:ParB/RepB/Spo0J family partition protein [SAR86 cluster bacterium]